MNVVVVRDEGARGTVADDGRRTDRQKFQLRRDFVYARRAMEKYELYWTARVGLGGGTIFKMEVGSVVAEVHDCGVMSYGWIEVAGKRVPTMFKEEEFAGHGGVTICVLRTTWHVAKLIEWQAREAADSL